MLVLHVRYNPTYPFPPGRLRGNYANFEYLIKIISEWTFVRSNHISGRRRMVGRFSGWMRWMNGWGSGFLSTELFGSAPLITSRDITPVQYLSPHSLPMFYRTTPKTVVVGVWVFQCVCGRRVGSNIKRNWNSNSYSPLRKSPRPPFLPVDTMK